MRFGTHDRKRKPSRSLKSSAAIVCVRLLASSASQLNVAPGLLRNANTTFISEDVSAREFA